MLEVKVNVLEIKESNKGLAETPGKMFGFVRFNISKTVGQYLADLMSSELSFYLGRERCERNTINKLNDRNGGYTRRSTLKGLGEITVKVSRDRNGEYKTSILPRSRQYEEQIREDFGLLFITGVSTHQDIKFIDKSTGGEQYIKSGGYT